MWKPKPKKTGALWMQLPSYQKKQKAAAKLAAKAPRAIAKKPRRIRSVSDARAIRETKYAGARGIFWSLNESRVCVACLARLLPKPALATDVHHYRGKIGTLLCDIRFFLPVCRSCHTWIEANRPEARSLGLLCKSGYNSMRQPSAYQKALEIYFASQKIGLIGANQKEPDPKDYDLGEWEAGQIKKQVQPEVKK